MIAVITIRKLKQTFVIPKDHLFHFQGTGVGDEPLIKKMLFSLIHSIRKTGPISFAFYFDTGSNFSI